MFDVLRVLGVFLAFQEYLCKLCVLFSFFQKSWIRCFSWSRMPCRVLSGLRSQYPEYLLMESRNQDGELLKMLSPFFFGINLDYFEIFSGIFDL